jgi:hypothetical protein
MSKPKTDWMKPVMLFLEKKLVKLALKKILGNALMGGFKAWLIKLIAKELFDEIGKPLLQAGFNQAGYIYDRIDGRITAKKIIQAREDGDEENYNRAVDDIFS